MDDIRFGDNLDLLKDIESESVDFIYIDPPLKPGHMQSTKTMKTTQDASGDREGFAGNGNKTETLSVNFYEDPFENYEAYVEPRLREAYRVLKPNGVLYFQIDAREVHYCKVLLDKIFGRKSFINEIIWSWDFAGKPQKQWPAKHQNILLYAKNPKKFTFNANDIDRIPYMAPGLAGPEKAARGKLPTDVWWFSIVGPGSTEKTSYSIQGPEAILERMVKASTNPGDVCLDIFAGSGTLGAVCQKLNRHYILMDNNPEAFKVMMKRLGIPNLA